MPLIKTLIVIISCWYALSAQTYRNLTVTAGPNGTTIPSGTIPCRVDIVIYGDPDRMISACPDTGYLFDRWEILSGNIPVSGNPVVQPRPTSFVEFEVEDVVIKAHFIRRGEIHEITGSGMDYTMATHGNDEYNVKAYKILYRFTAPAPGKYRVFIQGLADLSEYTLGHYGKDPTFKNIVRNGVIGSVSGRGTVAADHSSCLFTAVEAGEEHFFAVSATEAHWNSAENFTIRYESAATLMIEKSGGYWGTYFTEPSADVPYTIVKGNTISIAGHNQGANAGISPFSHWEVVSGTATIANPDTIETSVVVRSDEAVIRAVFTKSTADTLIIQTDGHGDVQQHDTVFVTPGGNALTSRAFPDEFYVFDSWSTIDGEVNLTYFDPDGDRNMAYTKVVGGKATIRANFRPAGTQVIPELAISDIDISGHRNICVNVLVTDTAGSGVVGLDSSHFTLYEDGKELPFSCTSIAEEGGMTVCLVIDKGCDAGMLDNSEMIMSAKSFIASMTSTDRCAVVTYDHRAYLLQEMTGDTAALNRAVDGINVSGLDNPQSGFDLGVSQLLKETAPRIVVVYSPKNTSFLDSKSNWYSIDSAVNNNVTVYFVTSQRSTNSDKIVHKGNGMYSLEGVSLEGLATLNAKVRNSFGASYILTYETPDSVFNGDTHTVTVSVDRENRTASDTAFWDESNEPPEISLTEATQLLVATRQPETTTLTITADITDDGTITEVVLYYRTSGTNSSYTGMPMSLTASSIYRAAIPKDDVHSPGVDFYIIAADEFGLAGKSPKIFYPRTDPWVIFVGGDENQPPIITLTPSTQVLTSTPQTENSLLHITVVAQDDGSVADVRMWYRVSGSTDVFTETAMSLQSGNIFEGHIPEGAVRAPGVEFYLQATDDQELSSTSPADAPTTTWLITVAKKPPAVPQLIEHTAYFADNGRGSVNRVELFLDDSLAADVIPDSLLFCWPNKRLSRIVRKSALISDASDPTHLTVTLPAPFPEYITSQNADAGYLGTIFGTSSDGTSMVSLFSIADSVGPLLTNARLGERNTGNYDTLIVDFTEPVDFSLVSGQSLTLIKNSGTAVSTEFPLTVSNTFPHSNGHSVVAIIPFTNELTSPAKGDSLRITATGPITDGFGNHAHARNRPVVITSTGSLPQIVRAVYQDRNADGMIDTVRFVYSNPVFLDSITITMQWYGKTVTATPAQFHLSGAGIWYDTINVSVAPPFMSEDLLSDRTSGPMHATVRFNDYTSIDNTQRITVEDAAAPVLTAMRYHFGAYQYSYQTSDTLYAQFSEPLTGISDVQQPFLLSNGNGVPYSIFLANPSRAQSDINETISKELYYRFIVTGTTADPAVARNDVAWINPVTAVIIDDEGNIQDNEHNKQVPLQLSQPRIHLTTETGPNPFRPRGSEHVLIRATANTRFSVPVRFKTCAFFYDKVGNVIHRFPEDMRDDPQFLTRLAGVQGELVKDGNTWFLHSQDRVEIWWNGTNRHGRFVGDGTYLAVPVITYIIEGEDEVECPKENIFIGVSR